VNPYDVLGLPRGTSEPGAIRRAYAEKLRQHRPDLDPAGFARIRWAKDALLEARAADVGRAGALSDEESDGEAAAEPEVPPTRSSRPGPRAGTDSHDLGAELGDVLANGQMPDKVAFARRLLAMPAGFSDVRDPHRIVALAEAIAFAYPTLAGSIASGWWESAGVRERASISLAELDRRRVIAGLAANRSQPARRAVFAIATGVPSTDVRLAQDVTVLESELRKLRSIDPLIVWLLKTAPTDPLCERVKAWEERRRSAERRSREAAAHSRDAGNRRSTWIVCGLVASLAVSLSRGCNAPGVTSSPPALPRFVPKAPILSDEEWREVLDEALKDSGVDGSIRKALDDARRLPRLGPPPR
jgi:hypothetical protein